MRTSTPALAALGILLCVNCAMHASIHVQAGDYVRMIDGPGGTGGVFHAQETNSGTSAFFGEVFPTFCVEISEQVYLPGTYYVQGIGTTATQSGNVLTPLAGWIYAKFLDLELPHQIGLPGTDIVKFNNSVQVAIWMEVLNHNPNPPSTPWTATSLATQYIAGGVSNFNAAWVSEFLGISHSGDSGVQIMNLRTSSAANAGDIQDQLIVICSRSGFATRLEPADVGGGDDFFSAVQRTRGNQLASQQRLVSTANLTFSNGAAILQFAPEGE